MPNCARGHVKIFCFFADGFGKTHHLGREFPSAPKCGEPVVKAPVGADGPIGPGGALPAQVASGGALPRGVASGGATPIFSFFAKKEKTVVDAKRERIELPDFGRVLFGRRRSNLNTFPMMSPLGDGGSLKARHIPHRRENAASNSSPAVPCAYRSLHVGALSPTWAFALHFHPREAQPIRERANSSFRRRKESRSQTGPRPILFFLASTPFFFSSQRKEKWGCPARERKTCGL